MFSDRSCILPSSRFLIPLGVVFVTAAVFLPVLNCEFVNWDDPKMIVDNPAFRGFDPAHLKWMFTTFHMGHYQPLSWVTLALDDAVWGTNPAGYHLTNLLIHAANAFLVYLLALRLISIVFAVQSVDSSLRLVAAFAALLFSIHPLRVESVAWVTERRDVLSGFFIFLTLICYLNAVTAPDKSRGRWMIASLSAYLASLLSKASGITLPVILFVLDFYPLRRLTGPLVWSDLRKKYVFIEKIPFLFFASIFAGIAMLAQKDAKALLPLAEYGMPERVAQAFYGMAFYIWKTVWPFGLSPFYEIPQGVDPLSWPNLLRAVLVLGTAAAAVRLWRRRPAILSVHLCYLLAIAPVLGFAQSGPQYVAARYSYLSCVGLAVLAGGANFALVRPPHMNSRSFLISSVAPAVGILIVLGFLTVQEVGIWHDSEKLWRRAVSMSPRSFFPRVNLGQILLDQKNFPESLEQFQEAISIRPGDARPYHSAAMTLAQMGRPADAVPYFTKSLEIRPADPDVHCNLGHTLASLGQSDAAIVHYRKAIALRPDFSAAHNNLANELGLRGNPDEAIEHYARAIALDPGNTGAHHNLGMALMTMGRITDAVASFRESVRLRPDYAKAHFHLGQALQKLGRSAEAHESFETALRTSRPDDPIRREIQSELNGIPSP